MNNIILTAGSATMDVLLNVPFAPHEGRTVLSKDRYMFTPGGSGAYTAVAAKRAGADSILAARVGADETGTRFIEHIKEAGVDPTCINSDSKGQTGLEVYLLEEYGLGGRISYAGANTELCPEDIELAFSRYPDLFTANMTVNIKTLQCAADYSREQGIPFVLDATGATRLSGINKLKGVDILIADEDVTEQLTGIRPSDPDNCLRACIALCDMLPLSFVVLKLGYRGAYLYDGTYCELLMSPDCNVVDVTAQHECFVGAFCAYFIEHKDVYDATRYALAASALCVSRVGGFSSIPCDEEIRKLL